MSTTRSERLKAIRANPELEQKRLTNLRRALRTPEERAARSERAKRQWSDAEKRLARNAKLKVKGLIRYSDPAEHARLLEQAAIGRAIRWAGFVCPPHLKPLYLKLRVLLGVEAARAEIRCTLRREKGFEP